MHRVEHFYNTNAHAEWMRLDRHRTEFAVTLRALAEFLPPPPATLLDVGGGPGRYAITLARQGY
ncbi:MAG: class I SAM-dependent methyltransferase, partial [Chloroflexota bacterium]|nr:class I SAM-dependent methyltransferase [Chloroflexota bacterium]